MTDSKKYREGKVKKNFLRVKKNLKFDATSVGALNSYSVPFA